MRVYTRSPLLHDPLAQGPDPATLAYTLSGGTAVYGTDYSAAGGQNGTLSIASGESSAAIPITIVGNGVASGANATFNVDLSVTSGATLGNVSSAVVTILEDDTSGPATTGADGGGGGGGTPVTDGDGGGGMPSVSCARPRLRG